MGKHLTFEERCQLAALHEARHTQLAIAAHIGASQAAVCRELQRNTARLRVRAGARSGDGLQVDRQQQPAQVDAAGDRVDRGHAAQRGLEPATD